MVQDHNIPQGYKQTELGIIPEDWEVKQISDFTSVVTGGTPSTQHAEYWGGDIRWMNSGELNLKFVCDVEGRITEEGLNNSSTHIIPAKCVLVGLAGQGKTRGTAAYNLVSLCTNQSIAAFLPTDTHSSLYLYYVIDSLYDYLRLLSSGDGGRGGLNKQILSSLNIVLPPIAEQRAIAEALSDVDGLIAALDKKIAKKRLLKQGAMQQLLTGKKRLPGFTDKWVEITFGEYVDIYRGGSPRPIESYITDSPNGVNWIKIGDVKPNDKYINKTEERIIPDGVSRSRRVDVGDFILSNSMSFGRPYILGIDGCIHDGWLVIQNYHNSFDKDYLYYLLCSEDVMMQYIGMAAGSSVKNLNKEKVASLQLCVPTTIEEQQAIATILSDMDKEIADLEAQRDKSRLLKSGMMQKLLTGQIRLVKQQAKIIPLSVEVHAVRDIPIDAHIIAGHIVNRSHQSRGWGRTKLQKSLHLIGYCTQLNLGNEYIRNTAGPDDQQLMNYIDQKFRQYRHVNKVCEKLPDGKTHYSYTPTPMIQDVEMAYEKYPKELREQVDALIDWLNTMDLAGAEMLSTLYAVWNNRIIKQEQIADDLLIADFYAWSAHKADFEEARVRKALNYMRDNNIIPVGWGKYIDKR